MITIPIMVKSMLSLRREMDTVFISTIMEISTLDYGKKILWFKVLISSKITKDLKE